MPDDVFQASLALLARIGRERGASPEILEVLAHPAATLTAAPLVRMDDGTLRHFPAYRCRYNELLGPTKGGIRYHPDVTQAEVQALALWMTLNYAVLELPYGGGKGGVAVDPKGAVAVRAGAPVARIVRAVADFIGPDVDIPAVTEGRRAGTTRRRDGSRAGPRLSRRSGRGEGWRLFTDRARTVAGPPAPRAHAVIGGTLAESWDRRCRPARGSSGSWEPRAAPRGLSWESGRPHGQAAPVVVLLLVPHAATELHPCAAPAKTLPSA
jgi:Glu/Leu/Phe/Val dehydrogenase, dimerisation domain